MQVSGCERGCTCFERRGTANRTLALLPFACAETSFYARRAVLHGYERPIGGVATMSGVIVSGPV